MSGIEPVNFKPQPDSKVSKRESKPGSDIPASVEKEVEKLDSVSIKNYFASLVVNLLGRVDNLYGEASEGSRQSILEQVVFEASTRVRLSGVFERLAPDASKTAAYRDDDGETSPLMTFFEVQAERIVQAHVQAFEGDPFGPEATAGRIVDFAVSFFPMFAADNPDMPHEEQVEAYREMVEGAVDEGFKEALQILGALPNEISEGIEQTRSLVDEKLDSFFRSLAGEGAEERKKAVSEGVWKDYVTEFFSSSGEE